MTFKITDIATSVAQYGLLKDNKFLITIPIPDILLHNTQATNFQTAKDLIQFRADSCNLPGVIMVTLDVNRYGVGSPTKVVYNSVFTDNRISFMSDSKGVLYGFFFSWLNSIYNFGALDHDGSTTFARYNCSYRVTDIVTATPGHTTDVTIDVFDETANTVMSVVMYEAHPTAINDNKLDWGSTNQIMRLTVDFAFRDWTVVNKTGNALQVPGV